MLGRRLISCVSPKPHSGLGHPEFFSQLFLPRVINEMLELVHGEDYRDVTASSQVELALWLRLAYTLVTVEKQTGAAK